MWQHRRGQPGAGRNEAFLKRTKGAISCLSLRFSVSCSARVSGGASGKAGRMPVADATPSINCSAVRRRGMKCEKLSPSAAFHSFVATPVW